MTIRLFRAGTFLAALVLGTHAVPAFAAPASASAQGQPQPEATPLPSPLPQPKDIAFPGTLKLSVNATDLDHHVMTMHETVPVPQSAREAGELVLLYPKWVPGGHAPEGTIMQLGGLVASAGGKTIPWLRDPVDVFAFHVPVTKDQTQLDADFKLLSPVTDNEGRVVMTPQYRQCAVERGLALPGGLLLA